MGPIILPEPWAACLAGAMPGPTLADFLLREREAGSPIFPAEADWFRALALVPPDAVRVVILGQDPYHGPGQAHGLAFSVPAGIRVPPSLVNIYKELERDLALPRPRHGQLDAWARQGVLLLNSVLTVAEGRAGSHRGQGWEGLTDGVIRTVSEGPNPVVFMLWGADAQKKVALIDGTRHLILSAPHPSPLSAHRGFIGCGHFSQANAFLEAQGRGTIDWRLPEAG